MMLHGAHDREIPCGARDDVRCEQLLVDIKSVGNLAAFLVSDAAMDITYRRGLFYYGMMLTYSVNLLTTMLLVVD